MNTKRVNYVILPEHSLMLECCKGPATVADSLDLKKAEMADPLYNPRHNLLVDFREFEPFTKGVHLDTIHNLVGFLQKFELKCKVAMLTTKPSQVVVATTLKDLGKVLEDMEFEVFSTVESAARFAGVTTDAIPEIVSRITELSNSMNVREYD